MKLLYGELRHCTVEPLSYSYQSFFYDETEPIEHQQFRLPHIGIRHRRQTAGLFTGCLAIKNWKIITFLLCNKPVVSDINGVAKVGDPGEG